LYIRTNAQHANIYYSCVNYVLTSSTTVKVLWNTNKIEIEIEIEQLLTREETDVHTVTDINPLAPEFSFKF
jgi:hypothetical protein